MSVPSSSSSSSEFTSDSDCSSPAPPPATSDIEFRCTVDDAWYNARPILQGDKLTVKFLNFGDEDDEVFSLCMFPSLAHLRDFQKRIRPLSAQLQDRQCGKVVQGTVVCASLSVSCSDVRFYDAVVDDVIYKDHSFANGEEECLCTFILVWLHGPRAERIDNKKIEHLCLVQSHGEVDPAVSLFLDMVKQRLDGVRDDRPRLLSDFDLCDGNACQDDSAGRTVGTRQLLINQETENGEQPSARVFPLEERLLTFSERYREDVDFGGEYGHQLLLIDNVDKELLPSTITEFIHRQTSVSAQVYIFPSLSSETYTRGAIVLECAKDLKKLIEFLSSPSHIVISCRGRPWVLRGTFCEYNAFEMPNRISSLVYQGKLHQTSSSTNHVLRLVRIGTEEFNTAKQLKELFLEFTAHQQLLHKRLLLEEQLILEAFN